MTSKPRPWPNNAAEARDHAAEAANRGLRVLAPIFDTELTEVDRIRRIAIAVNCFQSIARYLEGVGAQTECPEINQGEKNV